MNIEINPTEIRAAIQGHLDKVVREGIDYKVKEALNDAIAKAITPEVVSGYVDAAIQALTDPEISKRVTEEMQRAIAEGARFAMQEAIVSVAARLRGYNITRSREDQERVDALRDRLFPAAPDPSDAAKEGGR